MRVVLIQPPHRDTFGYSMPPVGLLHAAAGARRRGHDVVFLDLPLLARRGEPAGAEEVLALEPEAVGVGAMISAMPAALRLLAELRARQPGLPTILGGQGPELVEEAVVSRYPQVDAVAVGEADLTLADWLDGRGDAPGLVVRRDGRAVRTAARPLLSPLDEVPAPAWELAEPPAAYAQAAGEREAMWPIDLGRGCTYACTFCTTPIFWGRTARHLSPARAVDELDRLAALGVARAYVTHDLFTFDRASVLAICAEKTHRGNTLPWECRTRIDLVDEELLRAMAGAGCRRILFGVESSVPAVLRRVNKGGRAESVDVLQTLRTVRRAGIESILGVMAGVPGERPAELESDLQLMARAAGIDGVSLSLHWFNVTPGNGRAAEVALRLEEGVHADLVRGHDRPAGEVPLEEARLIAEDPLVFAAFRVFAEPPETPRSLYLLTRNAHLVLEVLPRTLRTLALQTGRDLRELLGELLEEMARASASCSEPLVFERRALVDFVARRAGELGGPFVAALAHYETALFSTEKSRLERFDIDPVPLVRALESGSWPPTTKEPGAVLFVRRGERVRALALSPFLADVAGGMSAVEIAARWTGLAETDVLRARAALAEVGLE